MDNSLKKWRVTGHSNKIGLYDTEKQGFIAQSGDVVLSFPFKDCILEGGMSDEESGREEKFFHEVLDRADIDALRDPKVLTGFRRIDASGEKILSNTDEVEFFDEAGELRENLLIKGNNLVALYSLREKLAGKVKLIYIDPPYNTGNDGFRYNDNFNHSTWLVFMRNRLEIARGLLRDDGLIYISIDADEWHYLKVLCDEVFWRSNFVSDICWQKKRYPQNDAKYFSDTHEYILCYSKIKENVKLWLIQRSDEQFAQYKNPDLDTRWDWRTQPLTVRSYAAKNVYEIIAPLWARYFPTNGRSWWVSEKRYQELLLEWRIYFGQSNNGRPLLKKFLSEVKDGVVPQTLWLWEDIGDNKIAAYEIMALFSKRSFMTPKPEKLLERVIQISTKPWDLVLDYHLGSSTTTAVAHKMGRRWIGIEQMDYIEDIAKVRLQKVIEWEQWGVSKSLDWKGGGSFVYMELKTYNIEYLERIESARTKDELHTVYADMAHNAFLKFWFDRRDFEREWYRSLPLEEQKVKLRELLDMNHLYLNRLDMDDSRHRVTDIERSLTHHFYGTKED